MSIILMLHCVIWYLINIHVQHESTRVIICLQSSCIVVQFGTWYTSMSNMNLRESLYCLHVQHKYTRFIICMPNINLQWCHLFLYIHVQHKSTRIMYVYNPYASLYYLVFDIHPCPTWIYESQYMSTILMHCCIIWYLIHIHIQHKSTRIVVFFTCLT